MGFLEFLATLNFSLIDLIFFELLITLIFFVDKGGNIKFTLDYLFGISSTKYTEVYVFTVIILGIIYFYLTNIYQKIIIDFFVKFIGWYLILSFLMLLSLTIFWISKFIVGRRFKFRLCRPVFFVFLILLFLFITLLIIRYSN